MDAQHLNFSVVGTGRAGGSFVNALTKVGWVCRAHYGRGDSITGAAIGVELLLLAVPDDAIEMVAASIKPTPTTVLAHLSGAKTLEALNPHERRASIHPLVSLPDQNSGATRLANNAAFAVAGDDIVVRVVDALGGRSFEVEEGDRSLYHATAAIASNHLVALAAQVYRLADRLGVPVDLYGELMTTTLENVRRVGPEATLTGPAARGDTETIAKHLSALTGLQGEADEERLYRVLAAEAARLGNDSTTLADELDPPSKR